MKPSAGKKRRPMARPSIIDPKEFSHLPKVMFHHERWSARRLVDIEMPCMVVQLTDWLYANVMKARGPGKSKEGYRLVDTEMQLLAFVRGKQYQPWEYIPNGATVVFKRLPFDKTQYNTVKDWQPQINVRDQDLISSFTEHQAHVLQMERQYNSQSRQQQQEIALANGHDWGRLYKRVKGIQRESLRPAVTPEEIDMALLGPDGNLVVPKTDEAMFNALVRPLSMHINPNIKLICS